MDIDWDEQWAHHAPNFCNGKVSITLPCGRSFDLVPGPGFGDCSHPTTRLMLEMMDGEVIDRDVVDVGCG
ncbi:MAG: 50S ribosomal protein L11 methyltransferase, partial [Simkaniaceae bacterium]|nr:50S ribosomal protein L11 methyltransferase [Simkaniaceae bacterium]